MAVRTKVETYHSEGAMKRGIKKEQRKGWNVVNTEIVEQGYGCLKTGCLGAIFLPLALLGKKPVTYMVTYNRG